MRPYELLIFDWDGTLADSEALIVQAMQTAVGQLHLPVRDAASIRNIIGLGLAEALQHLYDDQPEAVLQQLATAYQQTYLTAATTQPVPLFESVQTTLAHLNNAGYKLAVATGKSRCGLERALAESRLSGFFAATRCADETLSKPDPLMLFELLEELDVPVKSALMIGDTEYDIAMARQAGITAVAVASGVHESRRLLQSGATACLDSVADITDWLAAKAQSVPA